MYKIDFFNEKNNRLYFYEKYAGNSTTGDPIEYAYLEADSPEITYKTEDHDIKKWPKDQLVDFILNIHTKLTEDIFSHRVDLKSKSSQPRYGLRINKREIGVIHFLIVSYGLIDTLKFLGIRFQFGTKKAPGAFLDLRVDDQRVKYFSIFTKNIQDEYMINGLRDGMKSVFPAKKEAFNDKHLYDSWLKIKGESFPDLLREENEIFIDGTTAKILKQYNMPTTMKEILGKYIPKMLLNKKVDDFTDLRTQRIRMAEAVSHSAYKVLQMAIRRVKNISDKNTETDLKLQLQPWEIIKRLQASGMLQYTQTTNPLEELMLSTKITKTGIGNVKSEQVTLIKRDLNPSYYGVIAPVSTNEYGNVGATQTLANKAQINDRFGSIQMKEFTDDVNGFDLLSAAESLTPFYEYDDTTRRVMGNQQYGQFVQLESADEPLVQTGFESVIPHLVSDRFAIKAKKDGRIYRITKEEIQIRNSDGTATNYSIRDSRSRTKRGIFIPMKYYLQIADGQRVKAGDLLATTSSLKTGKLAVGKNLVVAEMGYRGLNYEDGWVVTDSVCKKYNNTIWDKVTILIPPEAKVTRFDADLDKNTNPGDVLLSYTGSQDLSLDKFVSDDVEADDVMAGVEYQGSNVLYRSPGGKIKNVSIKLNDKNVDKTILQEWQRLSKDIERRQKSCNVFKHNHEEYVDCISDIENTEILKIGEHVVNGNEFDGACVEIFIERENEIANGSKFTLNNTGGKGTVQYIIPEGKEPIAMDTKLKIEFIPTPLSIISRKNISILLLMFSGKIIYYMNKKIQELARANKIKEIKDLIIEIFTYMDASKDKFLVNETMGFFESKSPKEIIKFILASDPLQRPAFPLLVPPYKNKINIKHIQNAANALGIPLNEKVKIPEEDGLVTERAVPVGIMPVVLLEHFPKAMSSVRGSLAVKKQFTTGQGRSGTKVGAGATKLGEYDLFALSYKEPGLLIKELHGVHADNKKAQNKFRNEILKTGKMPKISEIKIDSVEGKTRQLVETFFHGAMLEVAF